VVEEVRTKMGAALKPAEKMEDEDEEGHEVVLTGWAALVASSGLGPRRSRKEGFVDIVSVDGPGAVTDSAR
jgi:hypothetical protein